MWRVALSVAMIGTSPGVCAVRLFIAKTEVKCGCIQGCCEGARPGMWSWWRMVQVLVSTKTDRFGSATRQS